MHPFVAITVKVRTPAGHYRCSSPIAMDGRLPRARRVVARAVAARALRVGGDLGTLAI